MEGIQLLAAVSPRGEEGTGSAASGLETPASNDPYSTYIGLAKQHNLWDDGEGDADPWK